MFKNLLEPKSYGPSDSLEARASNMFVLNCTGQHAHRIPTGTSYMKFAELEGKKRKVNGSAATSLGASSTPQDDKDSAKNLGDKLTVPVAQTSQTNLKIQQAKNFAIVQAQKECCMSNLRTFDSPFGNFLVPVIPTPAELAG